ncbi:unnamed protein product [Arabis nemorensis]|uniref:DUF659 domain-containing protein n=1 Tax=Arabis nemorensis TaxID=586526 RepID=A0A565BLR0_9BRAS|nr:unnamed protein product [Arabis nemorensis]
MLSRMIEEVGEQYVVQVVTDNASNYVKAGTLLMAERKHLYWTPCDAHCIDLMLEDIGKLPLLHTIKRNRLVQSRLSDMVFVKYNRFLQRRKEKKVTGDSFVLEEIDDNNEWLLGEMDGDSEEENDDLVFENDDLTWNMVSQVSGAEEPSYRIRAATTSANTDKGKGKGIESSSTRG